MLFLVTAMLYGRLTKRQVIVDWTDPLYSDDRSNSFPKLFSSPDIDSALQIPETDSVYPAIWRGRLGYSVNEIVKECEPNRIGRFTTFKTYSADVARLDYQEEVVVVWNFLHQIGVVRRHIAQRSGNFDGLSDLATLSRSAIIRRMLSERLLLQEHILLRIERFKSAYFGEEVIRRSGFMCVILTT